MKPDIRVAHGYYKDDIRYESIIFTFEITYGSLFRVTKEYSLTYVSALDHWCGDMVAYGQWVDLCKEELNRLIQELNLKKMVYSSP